MTTQANSPKQLRTLAMLIAAMLALASCGAPDESQTSASLDTSVTDSTPIATAPNLDDPYIWLEEVESPAALAWAAEQNAQSLPACREMNASL